MSDISEIAMGLTEPQKWAIMKVAEGRAQSPALFGQAMMERPGAMGERTIHYKAQGYGRMGGTMLWRLDRMGLVDLIMYENGQWCPTQARLTSLGFAVRDYLLAHTPDR